MIMQFILGVAMIITLAGIIKETIEIRKIKKAMRKDIYRQALNDRHWKPYFEEEAHVIDKREV